MRSSIHFAVVACFVSTSAVAGQHTLWDTVREHHPSAGPLEISVSPQVPVRDLAGLLSDADLVIAGTVTKATVALNAEETAIVTVYEVQPHRILFRREDVPANQTADQSLFVERLGGTMEMLGVQVTMRDRRVKPFAPSDDVLLFLQRFQSSDKYFIIYDPYGAFQIRRGRVAAVEKAAAEVYQEVEGVDINEFAKQVDAMLQKPKS